MKNHTLDDWNNVLTMLVDLLNSQHGEEYSSAHYTPAGALVLDVYSAESAMVSVCVDYYIGEGGAEYYRPTVHITDLGIYHSRLTEAADRLHDLARGVTRDIERISEAVTALGAKWPDRIIM